MEERHSQLANSYFPPWISLLCRFPPEISCSSHVVWNTCFPPLSYWAMNTWSHADMTEVPRTSRILQFTITLTPFSPCKMSFLIVCKSAVKYEDSSQTNFQSHQAPVSLSPAPLRQLRQLNSHTWVYNSMLTSYVCVSACVCVCVCGTGSWTVSHSPWRRRNHQMTDSILTLYWSEP